MLSALNISFHQFLAFIVFAEKSAVSLIVLFLKAICLFSMATLNVFLLVCAFGVLVSLDGVIYRWISFYFAVWIYWA